MKRSLPNATRSFLDLMYLDVVCSSGRYRPVELPFSLDFTNAWQKDGAGWEKLWLELKGPTW